MSVILEHQRWRQKDYEAKASLCYGVSLRPASNSLRNAPILWKEAGIPEKSTAKT